MFASVLFRLSFTTLSSADFTLIVNSSYPWMWDLKNYTSVDT